MNELEGNGPEQPPTNPTPTTKKAARRAWNETHQSTSTRDRHPNGRRRAVKPSQRRVM